MESRFYGLRCLVAALAVASLPVLPAGVAAQGGNVQGQVVDASSNRPLTEAQVSIPGTGFGMLTNENGRFLLLNVPPGTVTIRAELIGYEPVTQQVTVTAGASATADFRLSQTAISLGEIVVTGQGQATTRRKLGTTVDVINAEAIALAPVTTVNQLLQGRVAGATVNATSSQPGTGSLINFRGTSSVYGAQTPVIYIDGVRVDNDQTTAAGTGGEQSSALADLLTSDIERIEITKGGAASTLYGSDASTGVIQIFTKKGQPGAPRITARIEQGVEMPELKYIFDAGFIFEDIVAEGGAPADFMAENFFRNGHTQSYYVGVGGGTADITYNMSGRIDQADGTQPKNGSVIYALRGGVQAAASEKLRLDFSGQYTRSSFDRVYNGASIEDPLTTFEVGDALFFSGTDNLQDALEVFLMPDITEEVNRFIFSAGARYNASDRLSGRFTVGVDNRTNQQRIFEPIGFVPGEPSGQLNRFQREFTSVSLDAAGTYSYPRAGALTSAFTVGVQGFRDDESVVSANGVGFGLPGAPDFDEAAEITATEANSELFNGGIYLDEQLGLWDKLFVGAGVRFDAGSTFGDQVDLQTYPKFTGAYVISDEEFFRNSLSSIVDELKVRVAYGKTGKFPEPFLKDQSFSSTSYRGESSPRFDNPGNDDLKPEVTGTVEFGFDGAFFGNRLGVNFTYYDATTTDALFFVPEQPVTGQGTQLRNVGEISNRGIELQANFQVVNSQNLAWSVGGTFQTNDNEVTDMGGAADFILEGGQKQVALGKQVGAWFVTTPVDTNGDGLPDASERDYTGSSPAPTKSGSFNTSLTLWNRLAISALADWAAGHEVMDWGSVWATFNGIYRRERLEDVPFPIQYNLDGSERGAYSQSAARSAFIYDGDWFKLREISARYTLPESVAANLRASRALLYGSVRNAWIWSRNSLIDPELNGFQGSDDGVELGGESSITASPPRIFRFGVEVVF